MPAPVAKRVLYPHRVVGSKRQAVPLSEFPRAAAYLELHRDRLISRKYVTEAGRRWYEIWVPQDPDAWIQPKVVFPDISEEPRFFLDRSGAVVNGDCYWITLRPGQPEYWLHLILAVANSSLATRFYDAVCGNRLYAGRRRFITQYLERFPLPDPNRPETRQVLEKTAELLSPTPDRRRVLEQELDRAVWASFGLGEEVAR
jgi:hypothetical protein